MAIETLKEQQQVLAGWSQRLPAQALQSLEDRNATASFGERHGSWVLRVFWVEGDIFRFADLALTNSEATPDDVTIYGVITVRSAASKADRYIVETLYERRRAVSRLPDGYLADQLVVALRRALAYTSVNLTERYRTGTERQSTT